MFTIIDSLIVFGVIGLLLYGMISVWEAQIRNDRARREYRQQKEQQQYQQWQQEQQAKHSHKRPAYHGSGQQFNNAHRQYMKQQAYNTCKQQCGCQCRAMWECPQFYNPFWDGTLY